MIGNFPTVQSEIDTYFHNSRSRIVDDQLRLLISDANRDELNHRMDDATFWVDTFTKHNSEDGDSTTIGKRVIVLIGLVEEQLKTIYADIPESVLVTDDYTVFRFNPGTSGHAHVPAQRQAGTLTLETMHHLGQKTRLKNPLTPTSDAMPHGNSAKIWMVVLPKKVDASLIVWGSSPKKMTTRFHDETFTEDQVAQFAVYKTCYEDSLGNEGDHSDPIWLLIA